jgi:hypothetical protein
MIPASIDKKLLNHLTRSSMVVLTALETSEQCLQ